MPPGAGELVLHPNWVYTPEGREKLIAKLTADAARIAELEARDKSRAADTAAIAATPALTPPIALLLVVIGVAAGAAMVAIPAALHPR